MAQPKSKPKVDDNAKALEGELEALKIGWQRTQADFENFRRRTRDEQSMHITIGVSRALANFLPIAENLRRSIAPMQANADQSTDVQAWIAGVAQVARQFDQAIEAAGLTPIEPQAGDAFNPNEHEAISHLPDATQPADTIIQTIERGYRAGDSVLTPAKVVVSAGSTAAPKGLLGADSKK